MSGWPWPLDGVQAFFEGMWNWVSQAAVNAVSAVFSWIGDAVKGISDWVTNAVSGLWTSVSGALSSLWIGLVDAVGNLWNGITTSIGGLWTGITTSFSNLWTAVGGAFSDLWTGLVSVTSNLWNSISEGIGGLWTGITGALGDLWTGVSGALGNLWTNFVSFLSSVANGISEGVAAVGSAVGSAVNTIGGWVSEALKGVVTAMGTALQGFVDWLAKGITTVAPIIVGFISDHIVTPLLGALSWVRDRITDVLRDFYYGVVSLFRGVGAGTPEGAAALGVPLLLISTGGAFALGSLGAIAGLKVMGTGVEAEAVTDALRDAFSLAEMSKSVFAPILVAAYSRPIQYYYNAMFRPAIPSTGQADQMLFEEHITEAEWRQIYAYHGWKEQHITAWFKTMWREPSVLVLRYMASEPDVPEEWVRKKLKELGFIGEDQDAIINYGKTQRVKDERLALATADLTDFVDEVVDEATFRADLAALRFSQAEIDYRVAKAYLFKDRNAKKAAIAAAKVKPPTPKFMSESDLEKELELGLISPSQFESDMPTIGFSAYAASRKYRLLITPKPISPEELERRRRLIEAKIARTQRRYDFVIARHDLQTGFLADTIEYLSGLEKPPETRIATLQAQLVKAADEKALILQQRDAELEELEGELKLVQAG